MKDSNVSWEIRYSNLVWSYKFRNIYKEAIWIFILVDIFSICFIVFLKNLGNMSIIYYYYFKMSVSLGCSVVNLFLRTLCLHIFTFVFRSRDKKTYYM